MRQAVFLVRVLMILSAFFAMAAGNVFAGPSATDPVYNCEGRRCTTNEMREAAAASSADWRNQILQSRQGTLAPLPSRSSSFGGPAHAPAVSTPGFPITVAPGDLYFGIYSNYALSPLPRGPVGVITINNGGFAYNSPSVYILDFYGAGTGASAGAVTLDPLTGSIMNIAVASGGSGYVAPVVIINDTTGGGAVATATVTPDPGTGIRKFVDDLPGICDVTGLSNTLGACMPLAKADTATFPGSDYYQIGINNFSTKMHTDLPPTLLRGYTDLSPLADGLTHYLGPIILAQRDRPVRVRVTNNLPLSTDPAGQQFIPVDTTYMGAGLDPSGLPYSQNRAVVHLHGGATPWISDGTPHQWITPAGDPANTKKGISFRNVPDMITNSTVFPVPPAEDDGIATNYYTNQQSGRLMFYHEHAYGITRQGVYSGLAAPYLLVDPAQEALLYNATVPGTILANSTGAIDLSISDVQHVIPLVIQDKTFVDAQTIAMQDPTWQWGSQIGNAVTGDLWFPHVYMTNQWPDNPDLSGTNAMGRWDYGPWFWPPQDPSTFVAGGQPYACTASGTVPIATTCPGTPNASGVPEAFVDTPVLNGAAYPVLHVAPEAYRFQILAAGNDRMWNLQLYQAYDPITNTVGAGTEVKMVPAVPGNWPVGWPTPDGRDGGFPDPTTMGPNFIQIGMEGGLLPAPYVVPNRPVGYDYNRRSITVLNVLEKALWLGPAERADVIVDFTAYAGKTLIVYNDAPAPVPAFDSRNDYYTGDKDQTSTGGAPATVAGYGPNTRTVMQIVVDKPATGAPAFNLATLQSQMLSIFNATQDPVIAPETAYGGASDTYSHIQDTSLTFTPMGMANAVTYGMKSKAIQELFTLDYGRMNATMGSEIPSTNFLNQTTIPLGYVDPPTEYFQNGETQIWKITHNGVDTHAIHFHLFTVQLLNRVGWDGQIKPPAPFEMGWKDTVLMNPLEDAIVAMKAVQPTLPWPLEDSVRPMDVTRPVGDTTDPAFGRVDRFNQPITVNNDEVNFGNEYVLHCHLLGHEENDMMRPMLLQVPPEAPSGMTAADGSGAIELAWTDNSASETGFIVERTLSTDPTFANAVSISTGSSSPNTAYGGPILLSDGTATPGTPYLYRVQAFKDAYSELVYTSPQNPAATTRLFSAWSTLALNVAAPVASVSPASLAFGNQVILTSSTAQVVTLTNIGSLDLNIGSIGLTGTNAADYSQITSCGATLGIGSSCTISVTFTPATIGSKTASVSIASNSLITPLLVPLTGTGIGAPIAGVAPTSLTFASQQLNTTSTAQSVTLSNTGNLPLTVNSIAIGGGNASDFAISSNTCGASLAAAGSCTISVTFTPTAMNARTSTLTVSSNDPVNPALNVALSGTGVTTIAGVAPTSLTFAAQQTFTTSVAQTVTVSNTGNIALTLNSVVIGGGNAGDFAISANTCGASLAAAGSCTISVTFTPTAMNARASTLSINTNDPVNPALNVALSGTGITVIAGRTPTSLTYASQPMYTASAAQTVTVSNTGNITLTLNSITIGGVNSGDFSMSNNTCGATLAAAGSCTFGIMFIPQSTGTRTASVAINSNDPVNPTLSVTLSGVGTGITVSPTSLVFASQLVGTTSTAQIVTMSNNGGTAIAISSIAVSGSDFTSGFTKTCGASLAAGASCTMSVKFRPVAVGLRTGTITIVDADPTSPQVVALSGTGAAPTVSVTPASINFGSVTRGTTSAGQLVTVANTGTVPMKFASNGAFTLGGTNPNQFRVATGGLCANGKTLPAGQSCSVTVRFKPTSRTSKGLKTATLRVKDNAPPSPQTVSLSGTAQ